MTLHKTHNSKLITQINQGDYQMSVTIEEQFVSYIVKTIVDNPDAVVIERTVDDKGVLLCLTVAPDDLGRVIGKKGVTAQSIRTLLRALGTKNDARYNLKVMDDGSPKPERSYDDRPDRREDDRRDEQREYGAPARDYSAPVSTPVSTPTADDTTSTASVADDDAWSSAVASVQDDTATESMADRTRRELSDLDDLDV
jgi:uncharacterized protein